MNDQPSQPDAADEDRTMRLLRLAGPRPSVPDFRAARVQEAVRHQWQIRNRLRAMRRRALWGTGILAAAAALILIAGRSRVFDLPAMPSDRVVAVVERIDGSARRVADAANNEAGPLSTKDSIRTGEWIETDPGARVALRFADGTSVRLDFGSRMRPLSADAIELTSGAVYVDTDRTPGHFEVRTRVAIARDVGTQFEVRLVNPTRTDVALRLRVRTGIVQLTQGARSVSGRGGTEVTFSAAGASSRPIAAHGREWEWTASLSPPLEIEGQSLAAFLARAAHEHGWQVRYADAALEREAAGIVLHGSVTGLPPRAAVDVAIATSGLRHRFEDGVVIVMRGSSPKTRM